MRFRDLHGFQVEHATWLNHNFPHQNPEDGLLGMVEEVGELTHAFLKARQGIRGYADNASTREEISDALGDIMIYMASFCNTNGYSMAQALERAWEEVSARDWRNNPGTGTANTEQPTG